LLFLARLTTFTPSSKACALTFKTVGLVFGKRQASTTFVLVTISEHLVVAASRSLPVMFHYLESVSAVASTVPVSLCALPPAPTLLGFAFSAVLAASMQGTLGEKSSGPRHLLAAQTLSHASFADIESSCTFVCCCFCVH
jgi:hypothetical protein